MKYDAIRDRIKQLFGISDAEFLAVAIIIIGLVIGLFSNIFYKPKSNNLMAGNDLIVILDSVSKINATSYIGTNISNEPIQKLAEKDTIVKKEVYQKTKKSEFKGKVNINSASKNQLMQLYRIGEKTAEKIIEYRKEQPFTTTKDIMKVKGIGAKTFEMIKENIEI